MRIEIERICELNPIQDWTILRANKCTPSIGSIYMHPNLKFTYNLYISKTQDLHSDVHLISKYITNVSLAKRLISSFVCINVIE